MASKEYHREHARQYRAARREYVAAYKMEKGCEECGWKEHPAALHLDHIDPSKKEAGLGKACSEGWSFERIDAEIAKCRVLCANCHAIHSHNEKHYHLNPRLGVA